MKIVMLIIMAVVLVFDLIVAAQSIYQTTRKCDAEYAIAAITELVNAIALIVLIYMI